MLDEISSFNPIFETAYPQAENKSDGVDSAKIFKHDTLNPPQNKSGQVPVSQPSSESFWKKLTNFFNQPGAASSETSSIQPTSQPQAGAINRIPTLDQPNGTISRHVRNVLQGKEAFSLTDSKDSLSMEKLRIMLIKTQLEIEEEGGIVETKTHEIYQKLRQINQELLEKIKDTLRESEKRGKYFESAQKVTSTIAAASTLATTVGSLVSLPSAPAIIAANSALIAGLGLVSDGLANSGKAYFDQKNKEIKVQETEQEQQKDLFTDAIRRQEQRMSQSYEHIVKSIEDMSKLQIQKANVIHHLLRRPVKDR